MLLVFSPANTLAYIIFGTPLDSPTQIMRYSYHMGVDVTVKNLNVVNDKCPLCDTKIMRIVEAVTLKHKEERRFYGHSLIIAFSEL